VGLIGAQYPVVDHVLQLKLANDRIIRIILAWVSVRKAEYFEIGPFDDKANGVIREALVGNLEDLVVLRVRLEDDIVQRQIAGMCRENVGRHLRKTCYQREIMLIITISTDTDRFTERALSASVSEISMSF
jgi:hypothetical protein